MSKPLCLIALVAAACAGGTHGAAPAPATAPTASPATGDADHDGMPHRFENAEAWARVFDDPGRDAWQEPDRVVAALALGPGMVIADIGAGTGYFAVRLARAVPDGQVIATDIEPDMVRYMTDRATREHLPNLRAQLTPPTDPQLPEAGVDRILVVDVWHHLGDRAAYAGALARALRPGGLVAVVDFKPESTHGPPPAHRLPAAEIIAQFTGAGLKASVSPTTLPEQYIVVATR